MAYTDILDAESFGVAYAIESTFGTEGAQWVWLDCTMPQITPEVSESATIRAKKSRGSGTRRETGYRWYRVAFSAPLHGQADGYDPTSDTPATDGILKFLEALDGYTAQTYSASVIAAVDANTVEVSITNPPSVGALLAGGTGGALSIAAWVTSYANPDAQLFESLSASPGSNQAKYPTRTLYPAATKGTDWSFSFRVVGEPSNQDIRLRGCAVARLTLRTEADRPWLDVELVAYGGKVDSSSGGLQVPAKYLTLEPRLGRGGERVVVGSNVITSLVGTDYKPDGSCDIRDLQLNLEFPHQLVRCGARAEGVSAVGILSPNITASFWAPKVSDYEVGGVNIFEAAWLDKSDISVSQYFGDRAGAILCWRIPRGHLTGHPQPAVQDRTWGWSVTVEAGHYDGDSSSSNAGNKPLTLAIG